MSIPLLGTYRSWFPNRIYRIYLGARPGDQTTRRTRRGWCPFAHGCWPASLTGGRRRYIRSYRIWFRWWLLHMWCGLSPSALDGATTPTSSVGYGKLNFCCYYITTCIDLLLCFYIAILLYCYIAATGQQSGVTKQLRWSHWDDLLKYELKTPQQSFRVGLVYHVVYP